MKTFKVYVVYNYESYMYENYQNTTYYGEVQAKNETSAYKKGLSLLHKNRIYLTSEDTKTGAVRKELKLVEKK